MKFDQIWRETDENRCVFRDQVEQQRLSSFAKVVND